MDMSQTKTLFISATNTNIGKTYASALLLKYYTNKGLKVGYFKPFETGVINTPSDGTSMLNLAKKLNPNFNVNINDVVPYQFNLPAAPYIAKKNVIIDLEFLKEKKQYLESLCDILIIEGAGGLMVPIFENFFIIDLIKEFNSKTILICPSKLGCINDILLSVEALKARQISYKCYINLYENDNDFKIISQAFLKNYFGKLNFLDEFKIK